MKIQNTNRRSRLSMLVTIVAMLAMLACAFTVVASAEGYDGLPTTVKVDYEDLVIGLATDDNGVYYKVYDGSAEVPVSLNKTNEQLGIAAGDDVKVEVKAAFVSKNVVVYDADGNAKTNNIKVTLTLTGADADKYALAQSEYTIGAHILPKKLTWETDKVSVSTTYKSDSVEYDLPFDLPKLNGLIAGDEDVVPAGMVSLQTKDADASKPYSIQVPISLGDNYIVDDLTVSVTVNPIVIESIQWAESYEFVYGTPEVNAIDVFGLDATGAKYLLKVIYPADYAAQVGDYQIRVDVMSGNFKFASAVDVTIATVTIKAAEYQVSMNPATYIGNPDTAENPTTYMLTVIGDLPKAVRDQIVYTVNGKEFFGTDMYGTYSIVAKLPTSLAYTFVDANGNKVTELKATLTINKSAVNAIGVDDDAYSVIIGGTNGVPAALQATLAIPEINRKAVKDFPAYKAYSVTVKGSQDATYSVKIAIHEDLINNGVLPTVDDLYLYDPVQGTMVKANGEDGKKVMLNQGYYEITGLTGDGEWIFVLAPVHITNFWLTAPGIAIIVLLILALLVLLFFVGMIQRRARAAAARAEEEKDEDTILEDAADEIAEELAETVEPEEEPAVEAEPEEVEAAAEETAEAVTEEIREEIASEENTVAEDMAEKAAEELAEEAEAPAEEAQADEKEVEEVVSAVMEETLSETDSNEEEAVETFAETDDDDDNDDDDNDDDDNAFGGFNLSGLDFIDVKDDPEAYAALLEREKNGEIQLVYRYRKSYQSRLAQSQGRVQDYYSVLKNALLSYKGVKGRISWNYEAFNKGRNHLAKMNAKTKTLYLYLALDPAELADSKYGITDVSSKKKYASVPVLMKIKGDRKFKYALELIDKMCAENMQLPKRANAEDVDYRIPYQSTEELVEAGIVKKLVAAVPMEDSAVAASEEVASETTEA